MSLALEIALALVAGLLGGGVAGWLLFLRSTVYDRRLAEGIARGQMPRLLAEIRRRSR